MRWKSSDTADSAVALDGVPDGAQYHFVAEWLRQELDSSPLHGLDGHRHVAVTGESVQCMQAMETERSPGLPSLMVTTRRRLMPQGTSFSFLQAVTQALHSMQRSASQRNFIRAMIVAPYAALT
jgi:hypothetical protein